MTHYPEIHLVKDPGKYDWWRVVERVRVKCALVETGRIIIPVGYVSDFASVFSIFVVVDTAAWGYIERVHCA